MCLAPLKQLYGWGPISALIIIKVVSFTTIYCNAQWWPPSHSFGGLINAFVFLLLSTLTLLNFLAAVFDGPGFLPLKWKPEDNNTKHLQFCNHCLGYKAPRSHHCQKCNRCVLKMDHHCPWINTCVGFKNQASFIFFIFFAVCACIQSTIILSCSLYRALYRYWYFRYGRGTEPVVRLSMFGFVVCIISIGLSIGVVLGVGFLFFFQVRAVMRNRSGIEDWIIKKAEHRRMVAHVRGQPMEPFIYPYNLGVWKNILQVINWKMKPVGDGITWPIVTHSKVDQYTLTREQIEQKAEKKLRAKSYTAVKSYSGRWLPIKFGWRIFCSPPCTNEYRLPLSVGDRISVTRWRTHWYFGEKLNDQVPMIWKKGWFPRCCVIEIDGDRENNEKKKE